MLSIQFHMHKLGIGRLFVASLPSIPSVDGHYLAPAKWPFLSLALPSAPTGHKLCREGTTMKMWRGCCLTLLICLSMLLPCHHPNKSSSITSESAKQGKKLVPPKQTELLTGVADSYDGVIVEMEEPIIPNDFVTSLRASVSQWREQGKKCVWIKLPIELSDLVRPAVKEGFRYHHAEPDYLMLVSWLADAPDRIPINASHRVGIAAFVLNDNKELLVVKEKDGSFKGKGVWKLPTGVVEPGEDICRAAIREVKEETGIEAEFVEVLAFRQSHDSFFGKSDLMFVCMLRPQSYVIQKQASEVEAAQWMPVEEYVGQPYNKQRQIFEYVAEICKTKAEKVYTGFSALPLVTGSSKNTSLYFNNRDFTKP